MFGTIVKWIKLQYYRYTLMTGIYMLDSAEVALLHTIMFITGYFTITQGMSVITYVTSCLPIGSITSA